MGPLFENFPPALKSAFAYNKEKFDTKDRGDPKSVGHIEIATFATIVNPGLPICKNENEDISDAGNYRPVSLATTISKLLEHYISSYVSPLLYTTNNQFGFKPKHGTDVCIFFLNQGFPTCGTRTAIVVREGLPGGKLMHISHDFIATKSCPSYEF